MKPAQINKERVGEELRPPLEARRRTVEGYVGLRLNVS